MVMQGMFGELIHAHCGYQHDLRQVLFNNGEQPYGGGAEFSDYAYSNAKWRTEHYLKRDGDVYATQAVGGSLPITSRLTVRTVLCRLHLLKHADCTLT